MRGRFSRGNRKLSKHILIWNLPIRTTCPGAGECKEWCYENKIERRYKQTVPFRKKNLRLSKERDFVGKVVRYLASRKEPYVRIHESGDFYSQSYLDRWKEVARQCESKQFFCFTKSMHLDLWSHLPQNLQILQSYGSKHDHLINKSHATSRALKPQEQAKETEVFCTGSGCGDQCTLCIPKSNIHLVEHLHR
jgi:hypothetical protein